MRKKLNLISNGNRNTIKLVNIYAPNGNPIDTDKYKYKIDWYKAFIKKIDELAKLLYDYPNLFI